MILDIDETVLDNSPFQARLAANRSAYDENVWKAWVEKAAAEGLPGVKDFLNEAQRRSVRVFYITNRDVTQEVKTVTNLRALGLPVDETGDQVLSKNEMPGWGSEKASRRAFVAQKHRVLLLIGDDLGDFAPGARTTPEARMKIARAHSAMWSRRWFLLPNPLYGSWESALYGHDFSMKDDEVLRRKFELLRAFQPEW